MGIDCAFSLVESSARGGDFDSLGLKRCKLGLFYDICTLSNAVIYFFLMCLTIPYHVNYLSYSNT